MQIHGPHFKHWDNSLMRLGNLRYSRKLGWASMFENHFFHISHRYFWFTLRKLNFHCLAQVPWKRTFSSKQTKPGLMAHWLAWCNLWKPFQNMENWALKCYDVGIGNEYCWTTEKYRVFLLFPFYWIPFWPLGNVPLRQAWKYKPLCVNELFTLLIIC